MIKTTQCDDNNMNEQFLQQGYFHSQKPEPKATEVDTSKSVYDAYLITNTNKDKLENSFNNSSRNKNSHFVSVTNRSNGTQNNTGRPALIPKIGQKKVNY